MRASIRIILAGLFLLGLAAAPVGPALAKASPAPAAPLDTTADRELGQPGMGTGIDNQGGLSAHSLSGPADVAIDPHSGRLYVADNGNNRVLSWPSASSFSNGQSADLVLGQPNLGANVFNNGGLSARSLWLPNAVAVDQDGNLFVADSGNNRVLEYTVPFTTHAAAADVIGQPSFITNTANYNFANFGLGLNNPQGLTVDLDNNLVVADTGNNRVLIYHLPLYLATYASFDYYFGQPTVYSNTVNTGGLSATSLWSPIGLAVDGRRNLYIADTNNNRVLKLPDPLNQGFVPSQVLGQPNFVTNTANYNSGVDANGLSAPVGVAADAAGNVYVAEAGNNRVLEYNGGANVDTSADLVFGQGGSFTSAGSNSGGISADSLSAPEGVALDPTGNLYVADFSNNRLLEYDLPVAHGIAELSSLSPATVAAGSAGFVLTVNGVSIQAGSTVRWNGSDRPTTYINGTQIQANISAADVAAASTYPVEVFTPGPGGGSSLIVNLPVYARASQDSTADGVWGQPGFTTNTSSNPLLGSRAGWLNGPQGVVVDPHTGRLFVADTFNDRVLSWPNPTALANAQAADLVIGQPDFSTTNQRTTPTGLYRPEGLALDANGDLYVADTYNSRVLEYSAPLSNGMAAHLVFGQGGSFTSGETNNGGISPNSLDYPVGVALDARGNVFIADTGNSRVVEYDTPLSSGTIGDRVFGQSSLFTDTSATDVVNADSIYAPKGLTVDGQGNLFVVDDSNNRVLEYFTPLATDTTADVVLGQTSFVTNTNNGGLASPTSLYHPVDVEVDSQGNVFVADAHNNRVLEYNAPVSTHAAAARVFGQPNLTSSAQNNGGISATSLEGPSALALDAHGDLFVADGGNSRVLEYDRPLPLLRLALPLLTR